MTIVLFDTPETRQALYPFTLTRSIGHLPIGALTIQQYWHLHAGIPVAMLTEAYLQQNIAPDAAYLLVNASVLPDKNLVEKILALPDGQMLQDEQGIIAFTSSSLPNYNKLPVADLVGETIELQKRYLHPYDICRYNDGHIRTQFSLLTNNKISAVIHSSNTILGAENIFLEEGVEMYACTINATTGPVYIDKNALVMEGSTMRGPLTVGHSAVVKMGAKLYGGTTIGAFCTAGGEIKNSVLMSYSNKAHDGYLGDSVIGEWCNLGAGTSNSNVKNTGGIVKMWQQQLQDFIPIAHKAGLIMGDFSRAAINTGFNTGTVVGVSCNIFETGFSPKHVPSFSWGNNAQYEFSEACSHIANWKKMKGMQFTNEDKLILQHIYHGKSVSDIDK